MKNSILALALALPVSANAFECLPANPISDVTYLNIVGARAWGWVCRGSDNTMYVNYIVQLKNFYVKAACGRAIENVLRLYHQSETSENLERMKRTLRDCQSIPAAGSSDLYLYNNTKEEIKQKTLVEYRAKLGVR